MYVKCPCFAFRSPECMIMNSAANIDWKCRWRLVEAVRIKANLNILARMLFRETRPLTGTAQFLLLFHGVMKNANQLVCNAPRQFRVIFVARRTILCSLLECTRMQKLIHFANINCDVSNLWRKTLFMSMASSSSSSSMCVYAPCMSWRSFGVHNDWLHEMNLSCVCFLLPAAASCADVAA